MISTLHATQLYAQGAAATPQAGGSGLTMLVPLLLIFGVYYFLLIRPQQKKTKELEAKRNSLKSGDKVITSGGLYGKVSHLKEDGNIVVLVISEGVKVEFSKTAIVHVVDNDSSSTEVKSTSEEKTTKTETPAKTTAAKVKTTAKSTKESKETVAKAKKQKKGDFTA